MCNLADSARVCYIASIRNADSSESDNGGRGGKSVMNGKGGMVGHCRETLETKRRKGKTV